MCTLTMPVDLEMGRGHPGPLFAGPPHMLGASPFHMGPHQASKGPSSVTSLAPSLMDANTRNIIKALPRPCLVASTSPRPRGQNQKRVVFADTRGLALTHVKIMTEPSYAPPKWTAAFLAQVTQGVSNSQEEDQWEADFSQPAADYMALRKTVQKQLVALESVAVRTEEKALVGTVKVKNLAYHKEVFVRITFDSWSSQQDVFATYMPTGLMCSSGTSLLDTFTFRTPLPPTPASHRIDFCVGFRCQGQEYWDNNHSQNYVFRKKNGGDNYDQIPSPVQNGHNGGLHYDALHLQLNTWTEFATWHHLVTDGPYW